MIELVGVQKFFNKGKQNEIHVIDDVTISLPDRGMTAIFGPSGCGKTTLLNVIGGLDEYESGTLEIDGLAMSKDTDIVRNKYIGFIFQNYNLNAEETVYQNVSDSLRLCGMRDEEEINKRVVAALANVGMQKYVNRLPDTLSGGQQQRVAIARALVKNPAVILADEPTGNLDEANTVLVMDILKELSKEHLVLLVTHEEQLVDYYCDTVIELKDGRVQSTRTNEDANGYVVRDKNDIFLGEMEERDVKDEDFDIRYFGDKPEKPLRLTVVNHNGRLLLQVDSPELTVLDSFSELRLREGVFTVQEQKEKQRGEFDMSDLPPIEGKDYGKLFDFKTSVKRGYQVNFKSMMKLKGKKRLRTTLLLFGIVLVLIFAVGGTGIRQYLRINKMYNRNTFYVCAEMEDLTDRIKAMAEDPSSGVDCYFVQKTNVFLPEEETVTIFPAGFSSFGYYATGDAYGWEAPVKQVIMLPYSTVKNARVLAGDPELVKKGGVAISKSFADEYIDSGIFEYIKDYNNVLGSVCDTNREGYYMNADSMDRIGGKVCCVVDTGERAIYIDDDLFLNRQKALRETCNGMVQDNGSFGLARGEAVLYYAADYWLERGYTIGEKPVLMVNGMSFKVRAIEDLTLPDTDDYGITKPHYADPGYSLDHFDEEEREAVIRYREDYQKAKDRRAELAEKVAFNGYGMSLLYSAGYILVVNPEDYRECIMRIGGTSAGLLTRYVSSRFDLDEVVDAKTTYSFDRQLLYYVIHSSDPDATEEYITKNFGHLPDPDIKDEWDEKRVAKAVFTPDTIHKAYFHEFSQSIIRYLLILAIMLGFMSLCMYYIMKSTIMIRMKEIGIYRAIGVTKKNVIFRFAVETGVVVTLSVIIGYVLASAFCFYFSGKGGIGELLYYPVWYALIVLAILYTVGIICGIIPVLAVLRKTPSGILAEYDI